MCFFEKKCKFICVIEKEVLHLQCKQTDKFFIIKV